MKYIINSTLENTTDKLRQNYNTGEIIQVTSGLIIKENILTDAKNQIDNMTIISDKYNIENCLNEKNNYSKNEEIKESIKLDEGVLDDEESPIEKSIFIPPLDEPVSIECSSNDNHNQSAIYIPKETVSVYNFIF